MASERALRRVVLRGALGLIILACSSGLALVLLGDALLRGAWLLSLVSASVIAAILWLQWWWLASPALVVTRAGVQVVSALRRRHVPWTRLREIRPRFIPTLTLDDGSAIRAVGAPTAGVDRAVGASGLGVPANQPASSLVAAARRQLDELGGEPRRIDVETAWRWREACVAVGLVALATLLATTLGPSLSM